MQIVIDMPEGTFESVKRYYEQNQDCYALCAYVANGTPLPKGHGKLKDVSELIPDSDYDDGECLAVSVSQIKSAPTIIEADTEEDEDTE